MIRVELSEDDLAATGEVLQVKAMMSVRLEEKRVFLFKLYI